jgi:hypothetical protein
MFYFQTLLFRQFLFLSTRKVILTITYDLRSDYFLHAYIHTYILYIQTHIHTHIHTFIMVTFDTGTNLPAVSWNFLLAVAMMNIRLRWNGVGVPTQSHPNAASFTLSAWNIPKLMFEGPLSSAAVLSPWQLSGKQGVLPNLYDVICVPEAVISWTNAELRDHIKVVYHTLCWNMFRASVAI